MTMHNRNDKAERRYYNHPRDNGATGRNIEVQARLALNPRTSKLAVAGGGQADIIKYYIDDNGERKRLNIEVKTNSGTVTDYYTESVFEGIELNDRDALEEHILPNATHVAYGIVELGQYDNPSEDLFVFTREQFIDFLFGYGKPMVKLNRKASGYCLNIQSYNSSKRLAYAVNACLDQPMIGDWQAEQERKLEAWRKARKD